MKFQVGDVVRIISSEERLADIWGPGEVSGSVGKVEYINDGDGLMYRVKFFMFGNIDEWWEWEWGYFGEQDLELVEAKC